MQHPGGVHTNRCIAGRGIQRDTDSGDPAIAIAEDQHAMLGVLHGIGCGASAGDVDHAMPPGHGESGGAACATPVINTEIRVANRFIDHVLMVATSSSAVERVVVTPFDILFARISALPLVSVMMA